MFFYSKTITPAVIETMRSNTYYPVTSGFLSGSLNLFFWGGGETGFMNSVNQKSGTEM